MRRLIPQVSRQLKLRAAGYRAFRSRGLRRRLWPRRLAAARRADDGDESMLVDAGDKLAGRVVAAAEERGVLFAEGLQTTVSTHQRPSKGGSNPLPRSAARSLSRRSVCWRTCKLPLILLKIANPARTHEDGDGSGSADRLF